MIRAAMTALFYLPLDVKRAACQEAARRRHATTSARLLPALALMMSPRVNEEWFSRRIGESRA